ncbi:fungal pheromone STE3G-protein-coupled receptor [Schizopora paradoxa]|uniref:Fungal pheromone STE3G-protein-coupled receptor n=1 Tax=Schizopora paradoxa TaxID=27342 RepID=A0A0H2RQJ5_9AGAM|nr:fungal pheromone STE3G-protein-coupled receptor [Schizopora paradoxa]
MYPLTPYPLTPIGSFFGLVLSVIPLASHVGFQSWNTAIVVYAFWIGIMNFINFVNTIVWHDNVLPYIQVWCDITCIAVLFIHLFKITRIRGVSIMDEKAQRRRTLIIDLSLALGLPVLIMALPIIVQTYRYNIIEEVGCQSAAYSYISYIVLYLPQFVLNLTAIVLAPFTLRRFIRHRREMNEVISYQTNVTPNKYTRVMVATYLTLLIELVDFATFALIFTVHLVLGHESTYNYPYFSWNFIHDTLSYIIQTSASNWGAAGNEWQIFQYKWDEWVYVLHAIVFCCIFGTTQEARRRYRFAFHFILRDTGLGGMRTHEVMSNIIFNSNPGRPKPELIR